MRPLFCRSPAHRIQVKSVLQREEKNAGRTSPPVEGKDRIFGQLKDKDQVFGGGDLSRTVSRSVPRTAID